MRRRLEISPERYRLIANVAVVSLALIVFTGAAVRLTGSGLGCPTWPKCTQDSLHSNLHTHGLIEFGNRVLSGFVGLAAIAAGLLAFFRKPFRRDLAVIGVLLPLGVVAQAVLGGLSVRYHLKPGFVMGHYALSMVILIACVGLWWRVREEPFVDVPGGDRATVLAVRGLFVLGGFAVLAGTAATAAGPHAGGSGTGDVVNRLTFKGSDTLSFVVHAHSYIVTTWGLATIATWWLARRRNAIPALRTTLTRLALLLALQGVVGIVQYQLELPSELVWIHVVLATLTWVGLIRAYAEAGPLPPRARAAGAAPGDAGRPDGAAHRQAAGVP
jgi:cytochrome c oxidase assembly protein subunit 15